MTTPEALVPHHVAEQISELGLVRSHPVIVCDADEVLLQFLAGLEAFLDSQDLWLDLKSYALHGNIKKKGEDDPLPNDHVSGVLKSFFADRTGSLDVVPGAADALNRLAHRAQIVVLSNVPVESRQKRADNLLRHGIPYPVVANEGLKGGAVRLMTDTTAGPVVFLDDIPHNIASVREHVAHAVCIHYVADPRLSRLMPSSPHCDHRAEDWEDIHRLIDGYLAGWGY